MGVLMIALDTAAWSDCAENTDSYMENFYDTLAQYDLEEYRP